jgi:pimeloyl-ACP methyl ester carboxylesterase
MATFSRQQLSDLRGATRLAVDTTVGITDVVEKMHHTIQLGHLPFGTSRAGNTVGLTRLIYRSIRGTTRLVGRGLDAGMAPVAWFLPETESTEARDAFVSVINGVYGDHLERTGNPLAIEMSLRHGRRALDPACPAAALSVPGGPPTTDKVMLFVHGLCLNDGHWTRDGVTRGAALATELGYTPVFLRYNTGLSIARNGRALAGLLEPLLGNWPRSVTELTVVGHSMGGLVARSASHHGAVVGHEWSRRLRRLVFIGTPHHGAPLERGGNLLDYMMDLSPYTAPFTRIGKSRSEGITDLRYGSITEHKKETVPLPANVQCYALAATLARRPGRVAERLTGDGLVPVDSALGRSTDPARSLAIPKSRQWVGYEIGHVEMLGHPAVYERLRAWLE